VTYIDGTAIVQRNPHPSFDKITAAGFTFRYCIETEVEGKWTLIELNIQVCRGEEVVGAANFSDDGITAHCQNVGVVPGFQRKGIGTAIYVFAERILNRPLIDFWACDKDSWQSQAARAFWSQPNRPFGEQRQ
jgi:ribosomal protein S18 acetylase RimI-like enzyme